MTIQILQASIEDDEVDSGSVAVEDLDYEGSGDEPSAHYMVVPGLRSDLGYSTEHSNAHAKSVDRLRRSPGEKDEDRIRKWLTGPQARSLSKRWVALGQDANVLAVAKDPSDLSETLEEHPDAAILFVLPRDPTVAG